MTVGGDLELTGNHGPATVSSGGDTTVAGDMAVSSDDGPAAVSTGGTSTSTTVGGNFTLESHQQNVVKLAPMKVGGNLTILGHEASSLAGATAAGRTAVTLVNPRETMAVDLAKGSFTAPVGFTVERLDPAGLAPQPGTNVRGAAALVKPLAEYQFQFTIPTLNQPADLNFEINVGALDPAERAAFLSALNAGRASVAVKGDQPGSVLKVLALCGPGETPMVDTCVAVVRLDTRHDPLPAASTAAPDFVRFEGAVSHFSTYAVVTLANSAPSITGLGGSAPAPGAAAEGQVVTISAGFDDPDTLDGHTAVIAWGDGTRSAGTVTPAGGSGGGSVSGGHVYASGGIYTVTLTLTDAAVASTTATTTMMITGAGVHDGVLQIVGTGGNDRVTVSRAGHGRLKIQASFLHGPHSRTVSAAGVKLIDVVLGDGDDRADVAKVSRVRTILDGGTGKNILNGASRRNAVLARRDA
jgi:hypothetical protein